MGSDSGTLELALDKDPTDWLLRQALADAYEEEGDDSLSRYYRWTASAKRCPAEPGYPGDLWKWYRRAGHLDPHVSLGVEIWERYKLPDRPVFGRTRREAEYAMAAILA